MRAASGERGDQIRRRQKRTVGGGAPGNGAHDDRAKPSPVASLASASVGTGKGASVTCGQSGCPGDVTPSLQWTSHALACGVSAGDSIAAHGTCPASVSIIACATTAGMTGCGAAQAYAASANWPNSIARIAQYAPKPRAVRALMAFDATPHTTDRQALALTWVNLAPGSSLKEPLQGIADAFDWIR